MYLSCSGYTEVTNSCLDRVVCEYANDNNNISQEERDVISMWVQFDHKYYINLQTGTIIILSVTLISCNFSDVSRDVGNMFEGYCRDDDQLIRWRLVSYQGKVSLPLTWGYVAPLDLYYHCTTQGWIVVLTLQGHCVSFHTVKQEKNSTLLNITRDYRAHPPVWQPSHMPSWRLCTGWTSLLALSQWTPQGSHISKTLTITSHANHYHGNYANLMSALAEYWTNSLVLFSIVSPRVCTGCLSVSKQF